MAFSKPSSSKSQRHSKGDFSAPGEQKIRLNILLTGRTGQGKSATGNTILNKQFFPVCINNNMTEVCSVKCDDVHFKKWSLKVVEGPGLDYIDLVRSDSMSSKVDLMEEAFSMCYKGVNAFLFVVKHGNLFTEEDMAVFTTLKKIFGQGFLERVVVVMTGGDLFSREVKEEDGRMGFTDWCRQQQDQLGLLYRECQGRFVLLNNKDGDELEREEQIIKIINFVYQTGNNYHTYNYQSFARAKIERDRQILKPHRVEMMKTIISILEDKDKSSRQPSAENQARISRSIEKLRQKLRSVDQKFFKQGDLWKLIEFLEL